MDFTTINTPNKNFATRIFVFLSRFLNKQRTASSQDTPAAAPCKAIVATMTGVDIVCVGSEKKNVFLRGNFLINAGVKKKKN